MDLEFSPSIMETASLNTPNIGSNPLIFKSSYVATRTHDDPQTSATNNDESLPCFSAEIKVSKIENDLKQSLTQSRRPTESPFQKMAEAGVKSVSIPSTTDDGIPFEIPSTAEVMNVIESFAKSLAKVDIEREATASSEINRLDTSSPSQTMGVIVSPKKKFLIRSQSHTEPTSPPPPANDETSPMEDNHQFQRLQDIPIIDANTQVDMQVRLAFVQQPIKRIYQQTTIPVAGNAIVIPSHEVTSSNQLLGIKRARTIPLPTNTINVRSSTTNDDDHQPGDDHRKRQIRDSNREAARRCRERRRHYIEQLEGNLEQCKLQIKQLNEKFSRAERENTQLRTILTEAKMYHSSASSRLSSASNESLIEFANVMTGSNGTELSSETIERHFLNRNPH